MLISSCNQSTAVADQCVQTALGSIVRMQSPDGGGDLHPPCFCGCEESIGFYFLFKKVYILVIQYSVMFLEIRRTVITKLVFSTPIENLLYLLHDTNCRVAIIGNKTFCYLSYPTVKLHC